MEIELQCPQCGAPASLDETDRLLTCPYCRVRLLPRACGFFRYFFPVPEPVKSEGREIFYIPYWRMRGMLFSCKPYEVEQRIVDTSKHASDLPDMPESLGLRSQALRMRFVTSELSGRLVSVGRRFEDLGKDPEKLLLSRHGELDEDAPFFRAFIGEAISLVYTPIYLERGVVFDAILGEAVCGEAGTPPSVDFLPYDHVQPVTFLPTLCPNCGWDLIAERESCILLCDKCNSAWDASAETLNRVEFATVSGKERNGAVGYLPFWQIEASVEGVKLQSFADLVRFANLPKALRNEWEDQAIFFWTPAFKVAPQLFLRVSQQVTLAQPASNPEPVLPETILYPVTLSLSAAVQSLRILFAVISTRKKDVFPVLNSVKIAMINARLIFLPFASTPNEFILSDLPCAIQKNALRTGKGM